MNKLLKNIGEELSGAELLIKQMNAKIAVLIKKVAENHKLVDVVLIELKAVFARSLEKIQTTQDTAQQHLPLNKQAEHRVAVEAINAGSQANIQTTQGIAQEHLLVNKQTIQEAIVAGSLPNIPANQDTAQQHLTVKKQAEPKETINAGSQAKT